MTPHTLASAPPPPRRRRPKTLLPGRASGAPAWRAGQSGLRWTLGLGLLALLVCTAPAGAEVGQLSIAWDDATPTDHDGFKIERKADPAGTYAQVGTVGPTVLSYTDPGLPVGSAYCYRVRAYNTAGDSAYTDEACGTVPAQVPGLVAAYAFSEGSGTTTADASGNGQWGILAGATWTSAGQYGTALTFPGTSNTVTIANSGLLDIAGTGLTLEFWANLTDITGRDEAILGKGWVADSLVAPYYQYGIEFSGSRKQVDLYLGFTGGAGVGPISLTPPLGDWTHIAFTYDGTTIRGYLDGVQQVAVAETRSLQARGTDLLLGADPALGQPFVGSLDEVRIYNRALVLSELQTDRTTPIGVTPPLLLTVTPAGTGSGTVTSNPLGIDCGSECAVSFADGTAVALTATPAIGATFTGWSGDCTGTGTCYVALTQARSVTATFTLQTFVLTVTKTGTGSGTVASTPAGIDCGSTCSASFNYNTGVTLTATPAIGATFTGWSGEGCSGTGTCIVSMTAAHSVTATFQDTTPPAVTHTPVTSRAVNTALPITATITDNIGVHGATLFYRTTGTSTFTAVAMTAAGSRYSATIPSGAVTKAGIQYYLEARDAASNLTRVPNTAPGTPYSVVVGTTVFTDDPLGAQSTLIKAVHFTELLTAINTLRTQRGLATATWTGTAPAAGGAVRGSHLSDLRTALSQTYVAAGKPAPPYTDPTLTAGTTVIKANQLSELRSYVRALE